MYIHAVLSVYLSVCLQRFYSLVLLPAVRDDIQANRKLNYHLYMALKKALFKVTSRDVYL
jgi:hypothetical protein